MNKKILLGLFVGVFLITIISGLTFKQGTEIDLKIVCINAGYCSSASVCNVSIFDPNDVTLISGQQATREPSVGAFHNITINTSLTNTVGEHRVGGFCKDGSVTQLIDFTYEITPSGVVLDTGKAIGYFILIMGVFFIFFLTLWGAIVLPIKNKRNGLDEVIDVDFLKYAKLSFMFISYTLLVWIVNLLLTLSNSFILLSQYEGFFVMTFEILRALIWPMFVIMIIVFFVLGANDLKLKQKLMLGLKIK